MYPASVTLFWRDKTRMEPILDAEGQPTTDEEGLVQEVEVPFPPVTQDVGAFFIEGNALILQQDEVSAYLIPLDILDAVSITRTEVKQEEAPQEGTILTPDFNKES
jgi:hypothetical protein